MHLLLGTCCNFSINEKIIHPLMYRYLNLWLKPCWSANSEHSIPPSGATSNTNGRNLHHYFGTPMAETFTILQIIREVTACFFTEVQSSTLLLAQCVNREEKYSENTTQNIWHTSSWLEHTQLQELELCCSFKPYSSLINAVSGLCRAVQRLYQ